MDKLTDVFCVLYISIKIILFLLLYDLYETLDLLFWWIKLYPTLIRLSLRVKGFKIGKKDPWDKNKKF